MSSLELVTISQNNQAFVTSDVIADKMGVQHASIIKLIRKYRDDFEDDNLVGFEIQARTVGQHGGGESEIAVLDEFQATLLLTYMRNTPKVRDFKKSLVKAFLDARNLMLTSQMGLMQKHAILTLALKDERQVASGCGKGLSDWKKKRDNLQSSLDDVERLMQPMLTNLQLH